MTFTQVNTAMAVAYAGELVDQISVVATDSYIQSEASAVVAFGTMLKQGTADFTALNPTTTADKFIGVVRKSDAYNIDNELDQVAGGLKPKTVLGILKRGKVWVLVDEAVTPASPVRVRTDTNAGAVAAANGPGTFRTTASAGHTTDISKFARFLTTTTGAGLVQLEFDVTMRNTGVAD